MMHSPLQAQLAREVADRPTEARAYGAHNTAPPLFKLPAYAGVSTGMALWTQPVVSAYGSWSSNAPHWYDTKSL